MSNGLLSDAAVQAIQDGVTTKILEVGGRSYSTREIYEVAEPAAKPLQVATLTSLLDYLKENVDKLVLGELLIHVAGPGTVDLYSKLSYPWRARERFMTAAYESNVSRMWGNFYDSESFIISLQTIFVQTDEMRSLLRIVGNVKEEQVRNTADDGVTQVVTAKAGIAKVTDVAVPNPWPLRPFRTFPEVDQPESPFILRMRSGSAGNPPTCALFECDGGKWRLAAIKSIKDFLCDKIGAKVPIIA